ncbi:MAG: class I fructose-bisphosphate aldolase [Gaiellales bacterium]
MGHGLKVIAESIVADSKGILAADESSGTIKKRFDSIGVESTEESRRFYRNLLFTTPGFEQFIGGVILFDETIRQRSDDGTPFAELLAAKGVVPGIKVDTGAKALAGAPGETVTEGLDGLRERLTEYHGFGARFAKWRATISIGDGRPSRYAIQANAHALARYAALCQEAGLVPIVEPEVLMDTDHSLDACHEATSLTLQALYEELAGQRVDLEGTLLKPNMVIPGKGNADQASPERIAAATLDSFRRHVPAAVPGIVFLSGGQSEVEATRNLDAINRLDGRPWPLSFSYGRALQASALKAWGGSADNVEAAQGAFLHRARCNAAAAGGGYSAELEELVAA